MRGSPVAEVWMKATVFYADDVHTVSCWALWAAGGRGVEDVVPSLVAFNYSLLIFLCCAALW